MGGTPIEPQTGAAAAAESLPVRRSVACMASNEMMQKTAGADRADMSAKVWCCSLKNGRNAHSATDGSCAAAESLRSRWSVACMAPHESERRKI